MSSIRLMRILRLRRILDIRWVWLRCVLSGMVCRRVWRRLILWVLRSRCCTRVVGVVMIVCLLYLVLVTRCVLAKRFGVRVTVRMLRDIVVRLVRIIRLILMMIVLILVRLICVPWAFCFRLILLFCGMVVLYRLRLIRRSLRMLIGSVILM